MDDNMIFKDLLLQVGQDIFEANENQQVTYKYIPATKKYATAWIPGVDSTNRKKSRFEE